MIALVTVIIRVFAAWYAFDVLRVGLSSLVFSPIPWNVPEPNSQYALTGMLLQFAIAASLMYLAPRLAKVVTSDLQEPSFLAWPPSQVLRIGLALGGVLIIGLGARDAVFSGVYFVVNDFFGADYGVSVLNLFLMFLPAVASALPGVGLIVWATRFPTR